MKLVKGSENDFTFGLLGKGVSVMGDIRFDDKLQVEGKVIGKVVSEKGTLIIEEGGRVEAQIEVGVCVVRGIVEGNINAKSRIEIHKSSRVRGDMTTPVLLVEEGAVFNGSVGMGKEAGARSPEEIQPKDGEEKLKVKGA
jgi:cytoskeletal protein CcmA (bactofilin family)